MDSTYILLQHYWWFLVSLLGALLVFLLLYKEANLYSSLSQDGDTAKNVIELDRA